MTLSAEARDYIVEYESQRNLRSYGEMTWQKIKAYYKWECKTEDEVIDYLDDRYIDKTQKGKLVFILNDSRSYI